jgi:stage III sporulation protein SpoIIIAA
MIIDEISRRREVEAASTVKERGVAIIGSAHGDLESLLRNQELKGLLGGTASVLLGDAMAKSSNHGSKVRRPT